MTRDIDDPEGRVGLRQKPARRSASTTRLRAVLLMLLLAAAPATLPRATHAPTWVGPLPTSGAESLQDVPPGQRQRTEQTCGRCHRIEDRRHPPLSRGAAVMT